MNEVKDTFGYKTGDRVIIPVRLAAQMGLFGENPDPILLQDAPPGSFTLTVTDIVSR